ncbi:GGDEF domain protein [mine drainage metagenome]|uniref:GGDEF domain protein n=1 Tax=mine drainage metagenome TaxID=410659 RepID=A0A1J5SQ33_9ZZZZ
MSDDFPTSTQPASPVGGAGSDQQQPGPFAGRRMTPWRSYGAAAPLRPPPPADVASLLGMPLGAIPTPIQDKVAALAGEIESLRAELDHARHHVHWLEERADHHPQLAVLGRPALLRALGHAMEQSARAGLPGVLILLHAGGLEAVRLEEGLDAQDAVLAELAARLTSGLRHSDYLGYFDNGDFALVLTLVDEAAAADKLRHLLADCRLPPPLWRERPVALAFWAGLAAFRPGETVDDLVRRADAARCQMSDQ